jgi:hypothetical protein
MGMPDKHPVALGLNLTLDQKLHTGIKLNEFLTPEQRTELKTKTEAAKSEPPTQP